MSLVYEDTYLVLLLFPERWVLADDIHMNILIYVPNFAPIGGIEKHLLNAVALFAQNGCSCTLLTINNSMTQSDRTNLFALGVQFIDHKQPHEHAGRFARGAWLAKQILRLKMSTSFDVIYTNAAGLSSSLVWLIGSKNTRIFHHHHNSGCMDERKTWPSGYSQVIKYAPELIACSNTTALNLTELRGKRDIQVLYYLTDDLSTDANASGVPILGPVNARTLSFGFFGRLGSTKGIDWIVRLSSQPEFQEVIFQIHGSGSQYPKEFFTPFSNVHYFGPYLTPKEQAERLRSVDCVILPSTHVEGMPLSLMEAMSLGKPWVATDRGGVRELAVSERDCIVTPPTFEGFKTGLIQMMHNLQEGLTNESRLLDLYRIHFGLHVRRQAWLSFFGIDFI